VPEPRAVRLRCASSRTGRTSLPALGIRLRRPPDTGQSRNCMGEATARLCALCHWRTRPKAARERASVVASWSGVGGAGGDYFGRPRAKGSAASTGLSGWAYPFSRSNNRAGRRGYVR